MKKIVILIFIGLISTLGVFIYSCSKDNNTLNNESNNEIVTSISSTFISTTLKDFHFSNNDDSKSGPLWDKIKKWIKAHVGSYIAGGLCANSYPCGPCPGFCLQFSTSSVVVPDNFTLSSSEIENGERLFIITQLDSTATNFVLTFVNTNDFVYDNNLIISKDIDLGNEVASAFGKNNFIIKKGVYPVIYEFDIRGETVVSTTN